MYDIRYLMYDLRYTMFDLRYSKKRIIFIKNKIENERLSKNYPVDIMHL